MPEANLHLSERVAFERRIAELEAALHGLRAGAAAIRAAIAEGVGGLSPDAAAVVQGIEDAVAVAFPDSEGQA